VKIKTRAWYFEEKNNWKSCFSRKLKPLFSLALTLTHANFPTSILLYFYLIPIQFQRSIYLFVNDFIDLVSDITMDFSTGMSY